MKIELLDIVRFYILIILKKKCIFNFEHRKKNSILLLLTEKYIFASVVYLTLFMFRLSRLGDSEQNYITACSNMNAHYNKGRYHNMGCTF